MEKYDYLQNSKFLVDKSFKELTDKIYLLNNSGVKQNCSDLVKKNEDYFESIITMIKSLRNKTTFFILKYSETSDKSFQNLKNNYEAIKDTCSQGLEQLKERLIMENIVCCEETFLEFDGKYKSLKEEEKLILRDKKVYEDLISYFGTLSSSVNKLYEEMSRIFIDREKHFAPVFDQSFFENKFVEELTQNQRLIIEEKILENVKEGYFITSKDKDNTRRLTERYLRKSEISKSDMNITNSNINESYCNYVNYNVVPNNNLNKSNLISNFNTNEFESKIYDNNNYLINNKNILNNLNENVKQNQNILLNQYDIVNNKNSNNQGIDMGILNQNGNENSFVSGNFGVSSNNNKIPSERILPNQNNLNEEVKANTNPNFTYNQNNSFTNYNTISPIAEKCNLDAKNQNNISNISNAAIVENKANYNLENKEEANSWKMVYNSSLKERNSLNKSSLENNQSYDQGANINTKIKLESNYGNDNDISNPTYCANVENSNNNKIIPGSEINITAEIQNQKFEIDINCKYPTFDDERNSSLYKKNDNNIFKQIPIQIQKESNININKANDNNDNDIEEAKSTNNKGNLDNIRDITSKNFYENISQINNGLISVRNNNNLNLFSNEENKNSDPGNKEENSLYTCPDDLFKPGLKYFIIAKYMENTNKLKIYHEHKLTNDQVNNLNINSDKIQIFTDENDNIRTFYTEECIIEVDFSAISNSNKNNKNPKNNKGSKTNNTNSNVSPGDKANNSEKSLIDKDKVFYKDAATINKVNENDRFRKLFYYISGGIETNTYNESKRFLCFDFNDKKLRSLPDMLESRSNHSMIECGNCLYVVGGKDKNTCEKFDFGKNEWVKLPNLKSERRNAGLFVHHNFLYAFFGRNKSGCIDSIEKMDLKTNKSWEIHPYKKEDGLDLKMAEFAISTDKNNYYQIHIIGGKNEYETLNTVIIYDFKENKFLKVDHKFPKRVSFKESNFVKLTFGGYGNFSNENDHIVRLS